MASQYDTETKAQALALLELGNPASHVAQELSIPERTVSRWAGRWRQMAAEEGDRILTDEDYRLAVRTSQLLHDALDQMEGKEDLWKYLVPLNIVRGTSIDKILKRKEAKQPVQATNVLIVVNAQKPETIEGEVVREADGQDGPRAVLLGPGEDSESDSGSGIGPGRD